MEKNKPKPTVSYPPTSPIIKELEPMKETKVTLQLPLLVVTLAIVIAGAFTGYVLATGNIGGPAAGGKTSLGGSLEGKKIVGVVDEKTFKDSTEGILREGAVDGEGTHHIERPGGESQNVYITSSNISMDDYIGKNVKVWGETFAAQKAGWLMDVGRLEVLN